MVRNRNAHGTLPQSNYAPRINVAQKELMVEFLESHPEMTNSALGSSADDRRRLWKELTLILNADGLGATKSIDGWRDSWSEIKSYVKKKTAAILSSIDSSGGKLTKGSLLHPLEERISALIWESGITASHVTRLSVCENYEILSETDSSQTNLTPSSGDLSPREDLHSVVLSDNSSRLKGTDGGTSLLSTRDSLEAPHPSMQVPECITVKMEMPDPVYMTASTATEEITPDRGPVNGSRKRHLPPEVEQPKSNTTDEAGAAQLRPAKRHVPSVDDVSEKNDSSELNTAHLRSAIAMERLADSVYRLVEHQRHVFKVQTELEEKRLKLLEERTQTEEKKVSIFQQAVMSFISFFKK